MAEKTDILIAGAGIAGLTAALSLAGKGLASTVVEAFDKPSEVGAGIQLAPNATHVLESLGVLETVRGKAVAPVSIRLGDAASGRIMLDMRITRNWMERMGAPYLTAHRAVLHGALYDAAVADPAVTLLTGHRIAGATEDSDGIAIEAETADGARELKAGVLIGADGIWSRLRNAVAGAAHPAPTGRIAWRAVGPAKTAGKMRRGL